MRGVARFLALAAGLAMMISAFMPWLRGVTPSKLRLSYLFQGLPDNEPLARLADHSAPFARSMGAALLVAGALVLLGGLFGGRTLIWLGSLLGLAAVALLYLQIALEYDTVPGNRYGATIGQAGVLVALAAGLWPRRRRPGMQVSPPPPPPPASAQVTQSPG